MRGSMPYIILLVAFVLGVIVYIGPSSKSHPLIGEPAPDLTLEILGGDSVSLSRHLGSDIVVLDFWAAWCPPCVKSMPAVRRVVDYVADHGVVLYAINQGEDLDTVSKFLAQLESPPVVAMDFGWQAARSYEVTTIPQIVIIDRDGIVRFVHVGVGAGLESRLGQELDSLITIDESDAVAP